jgi:hypothetical protein
MRGTIWLFLLLGTGCAAQTPRPEAEAPGNGPIERVSLSGATSIPLEKIGDFYYMNVLVNGRPFRFTLETGANFVAVSGRLAQALNLRVDSASGPRGPEQTVRLESLALGGATLKGVTAGVTNLFTSMPEPFDGIISIAVLRPFLATIDFPNRALKLERGTLPQPNGRDILPIPGTDFGGRVDVMLDIGGIGAPAVLDTRSFIAVALPDSLESRLSFADSLRSAGRARGPSLGTFTLRQGRLATPFRIGSFAADKPTVILRNRGSAVIGVPLLEQFVVTLDIANKRMRFARPDGSFSFSIPEPPAPQSSANAPPGRPPMGFGLSPRGDGSLFIVGVVPGSNAERAGLREGDRLLELDGVTAAQMNVGIFRGIAAKGTAVRIAVEREGKRMEFVVTP